MTLWCESAVSWLTDRFLCFFLPASENLCFPWRSAARRCSCTCEGNPRTWRWKPNRVRTWRTSRRAKTVSSSWFLRNEILDPNWDFLKPGLFQGGNLQRTWVCRKTEIFLLFCRIFYHIIKNYNKIYASRCVWPETQPWRINYSSSTWFLMLCRGNWTFISFNLFNLLLFCLSPCWRNSPLNKLNLLTH